MILFSFPIFKNAFAIIICSSSYYVCNLKTASSNRILTICDALYDDFKKYYDKVSKYKIFNDDFFIFGNDKDLTPLAYKQVQRRKGEIANKAGIKEIRLHDLDTAVLLSWLITELLLLWFLNILDTLIQVKL